MSSQAWLTKQELWESVIESASLTLKLLSHWQDEDHHVIQTALPALKALVEMGPSASMSQESGNTLNQEQDQKQPQEQPQEQPKEQPQTQKQPESIHQAIDPHWTVVTPNEVKVQLDDTHVVTARTVTTERELDALIRKMYHCDMVALDCEFMTSKKNAPSLKVLQVAVSRSEGYAIIIDKLDPLVIQTKLKAVLEDSTVNYVAWAFKMDALAITAAIGNVHLAPVLDLQSKLRPVAVEKLNLFSGITKFASDWEGLGEFQKAKLLGDCFDYHEANCVWLVDPLPVSALVYAIFDVVSLIVLTESTMKYPTNQSHFWPNNFDEETPKAQNRYKQQLQSAGSTAQQRYQAGSPQNTVKTTSSENSSRALSNQSSSSSIKNTNTQNSAAKSPIKSEGGVYFSPDNNNNNNNNNNKARQPNSWGEFSKQEHSTFLDKSASPRTAHTPPVKNTSVSPRPSFRPSQSIPNSPRKSPAATAGAFANKPDLTNVHNGMRNSSGIISDQKVTFTNEENVPGGPEITVWGDFAKHTMQEWGKRKDVGIEAFDEMKTVVSPKAANATTTADPDKQVSEWDKEDDRPQIMQMKMNQIPIRSTFTGPKAVNPNDTDDDDDDEDDDDDDDDDDDNDLGKGQTLNIKFEDTPDEPESFENKWQQIHNQNNALSPRLKRQSGQINVVPGIEPNHDDIDIEDLSIYQESLYLYTGDTIKMCKISAPDELDKVIMPPLNGTATIAITFHYVHTNTNNRPRLKGLQFYFPIGDSYIVVIDQACFNIQATTNSKLATLLTHPSIYRVAWLTDYVVADLKRLTGITLGRTVDLSRKANSNGQPHGQDFYTNLGYYLKDWPALEQLNDEKEKYEKSAGNKFSSPWDKEKLPMTVLEYTSLVGAAVYNLYQYPDLVAVSDQPYIYGDH